MNGLHILKGLAMGIVETVPGVSSSTIAMLLGIYESIIAAISDLTTKRYKKAILFLLPIGIGILIGVAFSALAVKYLLEMYPVPTHYLFIGLIIGMLPLIWRNGHSLPTNNHPYKSHHFLLMILLFILVASFRFIQPENEVITESLTGSDAIYLFFSGWLASIALVLPGMSGALILMIVGAYYTALNALLTVNLPIILTLIAGIVIGVLLTGKFVRYLLQNFHKITYASIIGMLAGSVIILYPGIPGSVIEFIVSVILLIVGFVFAFRISNR